MIEVLLNGRLGNWLFQYAAARALALRTGTGATLNVSRYASWRDPLAAGAVDALRFFALDAATAHVGPDTRRALEKLRLAERRADFSERTWGYDPRFAALGPATRLCGYFQSPRYWEGFDAALRADFTPRRLPDDPALARTLVALQSAGSVSVHVRRGDYLTTERELHGVCGAEYYARAMQLLRERVSGARFFVFSDDLAWCRQHFTDPDTTVVDLAASTREPALDLYLMSRCSHHVISNSTYSWWGAWLDASPAAIVCTPERWFNDPAMDALAMRDTVPAQWQRVPCDDDQPPAGVPLLK